MALQGWLFLDNAGYAPLNFHGVGVLVAISDYNQYFCNDRDWVVIDD